MGHPVSLALRQIRRQFRLSTPMKATYRPNPILVWPVHNAMEQNEDSSPQELSRRDFGPNGFRWLTLKRIQYRDRTRRLRFWECAERRTRYGEVDGVAIIARVHSKSAPTRIILEAQYRPAIDAIVIELPAGLVDDQESSAEAAIRELKEETGFVGKVVNESPICYCDPGMTNANMTFVEMDIDGDSEKNQAVKPELEEGEDIEVFLLPVEGLYEALLVGPFPHVQSVKDEYTGENAGHRMENRYSVAYVCRRAAESMMLLPHLSMGA